MFSVVFGEEATKKTENTKRYDPRRSGGRNQTARVTLNNRGGPHRNGEYRRQFRQLRQRTFHPSMNVPKKKWVNPLK